MRDECIGKRTEEKEGGRSTLTTNKQNLIKGVSNKENMFNVLINPFFGPYCGEKLLRSHVNSRCFFSRQPF